MTFTALLIRLITTIAVAITCLASFAPEVLNPQLLKWSAQADNLAVAMSTLFALTGIMSLHFASEPIKPSTAKAYKTGMLRVVVRGLSNMIMILLCILAGFWWMLLCVILGWAGTASYEAEVAKAAKDIS